MSLEVEFSGFDKKLTRIEVEEGTTYIQVLEMLGINPETAIVIRDNLPTPADEAIEEGSIKILRVISGG
ncbi:MAG TPA: MoaD/ThiS family protein [Archaeoglobaceae archaeon]|nr:MoaD/ThiS family protein [Archaeoglobaceae archaeon]